MKKVLLAELRAAVAALNLNVPSQAVDKIKMEYPSNFKLGHISTNAALVLSKPAGIPAPLLADMLASHLALNDAYECVSVASPGFINLFYSDKYTLSTLQP